MTSFPLLHPDVLAFVCGLALFCSAAIAYRLRNTRETETRMPRIWLATFAATGGITQWLGLINTNPTDALALRYAQLFLAASSFVALIAFARDGVRFGQQPSLRLCVNFSIPLIFALFIVKASLGGLDPAFRYGLALPAGLLGAAVLYAFDRTESEGDWGMLLVAAALAFYALGFALAVPELEAFAALAAMCGFARHYRGHFPLEENASAVTRWRGAAAFAVVALIGALALATRETPTETIVAAATVVEDPGATENPPEGLLEPVEIDSRQAAREQAAAQRYKQGMSFLLVVVVIAVVWIGLSQIPGLKR